MEIVNELKNWLEENATRLKDYSAEEIETLAAVVGIQTNGDTAASTYQIIRQWKTQQNFKAVR